MRAPVFFFSLSCHGRKKGITSSHFSLLIFLSSISFYFFYFFFFRVGFIIFLRIISFHFPLVSSDLLLSTEIYIDTVWYVYFRTIVRVSKSISLSFSFFSLTERWMLAHGLRSIRKEQVRGQLTLFVGHG